ncbi:MULTISPECIES: PTS mannose/fructose/sorbose/N-acetylgalactosamine transporter subunit IIC [Anaerostipes]|uniref:PTS mannose/fructose/sorbose/N-acetylgalactosamine transporter subunit IIC n=1 Tax=Anaerostipes TaxID=207244 RepID=UPI00258C03F5|nr:PTS sugar transporter subunit IIC [Anaerostipes sp.]MCI5623316.1 PTS sugar transporter subunit IIC [Anaerostipes sp.]MDY2726831.1 PTS sugar transporter subunit IIC [Anaerostipes faecalis]
MQLFLLAVAMGLCNWFHKMEIGYNTGYTIFESPITSGVLAGIILGKPIEGLIIGGTIQLIYVGVIAPGGNFPADSAIAGACVAPIALMTGMKASVAVTLAVPVGLLGVFLINLRKTLAIRIVHAADKYAKEADTKGIYKCAVIYPALLNILVAFLPVFIVVIFGTSVVDVILKYIPEAVMHGLEVAGGMLPALGFALIMHMIGKPKYIPFMIMGFFIMQMTGWSNLILAIFGGCLAFIVVTLKKDVNMEVNE